MVENKMLYTSSNIEKLLSLREEAAVLNQKISVLEKGLIDEKSLLLEKVFFKLPITEIPKSLKYFYPAEIFCELTEKGLLFQLDYKNLVTNPPCSYYEAYRPLKEGYKIRLLHFSIKDGCKRYLFMVRNFDLERYPSEVKFGDEKCFTAEYAIAHCMTE